MDDVVESIATAGPLAAALTVAAVAGLVSFLSPCVLPLVPGYLSYVTGLAGADIDAGHRRGRVLGGVLLFITGFSVIFVLGAVLASRLSVVLYRQQRAIEIVVGALVILFGLSFAGLVPALQRQWQVHRLPSAGLFGAPVLGAVFALSWIPCTGPTITAMVGLASTSGSVPRAVALALAYCLGLGLPFVAFALSFQRVMRISRVVRRNSRWVTRIGGALLVLTGLALVSGAWAHFIDWLRVSVGSFELLL